MKTIKNQQTKIVETKDGKESTFNFGGLLKAVINHPPPAGFSVEEMRNRLRIWGTIDTAGEGDISMEDADFVILKTQFDIFKWASVNKEIIELADHLASL